LESVSISFGCHESGGRAVGRRLSPLPAVLGLHRRRRLRARPFATKLRGRLEIVTGEQAKRQLPDLQQLGEHAHQLPMLHTDNTPEHNLQQTITIRAHIIAGSDI
jgi:hypothetical protein